MTDSLDFDDFFRSAHGHEPFPWQRRLAAQVVRDGRWPELLDLPTGTGKTAAIDIALFALASRPDVFPRRIAFVVDRRVVVDQAAEHARATQEWLTSGCDGTVTQISNRLRELWGGKKDEPPFEVAVLRGGMPRDEGWAARPDRPVVVFSTVDQVGSRLLFRGYGVSPRMAPIHAGLLGNDTLFLLDEVHLSTAFAETMRALDVRWRRWYIRGNAPALPDRWAVVRMSATPRDERRGPRFGLDDEDRKNPIVAKRLMANKRAILESMKVTGDESARTQEFAAACTERAVKLLSGPVRTLAVIVNRVDLARSVFDALENKGEGRFETILITGRMRPLDRDEILGRRFDPASLLSRLATGRTRSESDRPLIVVSTQSIEAGADFDFDAMVTECASVDALRQRFGRVDRVGDLEESRSAILVRQDQIGVKSPDPIYGDALVATWRWLEASASSAGGQAEIDFGIAAFPSLPENADERRELFPDAAHPPVLFPAHLDSWAQTNPRPEPDPDVALWLHGPRESPADVSIVWRGDLTPDLLGPGNEEEIAERLVAVPPSSLEALSVPIHAAKRWLSRNPAEPIADVEGGGPESEDELSESVRGRKAVRIAQQPHKREAVTERERRTIRAEIIEAKEIRPGDTIIVPATYGGVRMRRSEGARLNGNWDPLSDETVTDLGDWASLIHRGRAVLRLFDDSSLLANAGPVPKQDPETEESDISTRIAEWLDRLPADENSKLAKIVFALRTTRYRILEHQDGTVTLIGKKRIDPKKVAGFVENTAAEIVTEDDDSSSFIGVEVPLRQHLDDVEHEAKRFARNLALPDSVVQDLALAAKLHDIGKADPRFQQMLVGGSEVGVALLDEPLAKSVGHMRDARARERARVRSNYPRGYRHELLSVAMLEDANGLLAGGYDRDLVLHLVGSHHGWCRPFAPAVEAGSSIDVALDLDGKHLEANTAHNLARLDSGVADRFFALIERYGWWGLAWLEAIMRLADHRASEARARARGTPAREPVSIGAAV